MRMKAGRLWILLLAAAFLILWCLSVGVTLAGSPQEPIPIEEAAQAETMGVKWIGIVGWCLVALGFLGVAVSAALGGRPRYAGRRSVKPLDSLRPSGKVTRSVYCPPSSHRYRRNIDRRR